MIQWTPYAFVRITLFYLAGIVAGKSLSLDPTRCAAWATAAIVAYLLLVAVRRNGLSGIVSGSIGLAAVTLLGCVSGSRTPLSAYDHVSYVTDSVSYFTGVVISYPGRTARTWKIVVDVRSVNTGAQWKTGSGKVMVYLDRDAYPAPFRYGDVLLFRGRPQEVPGPMNPEAFDYRRFLSLRNIHNQHYVRKNEAAWVGSDPPSRIVATAFAARQAAVDAFRRYVPGEREHAVACALVLGYKEDLDDELSNAFAASGTMHVLAVSGLHVGILYGLVMILLKPMRRVRGGKWAVAVCSIAVLWAYAFITGLSPSVLRAAMMCTFVTLAGPWGRRSSLYNTFAVSAFVLLVNNPNLVYAVGFQLSYAAVFGIVRFYPWLVRLWEPSSWIGSKVWELSCVSVAAQLATFPLSMYYFHQFPVWFLLSNLVAIPLSFVILVTGLVTLAAALWPAAAAVCGYALSGAVWLLNWSVEATADLPFSVIDNIYLSGFQCCMLAGVIAVVAALVNYRNFMVVCVCGLFCFAFAADGWLRLHRNASGREVVVYQLSKGYGLELRNGFQSYFLVDSALAGAADVSYHTEGYRLAAGVSRVASGTGQPFVRELGAARMICWNGYTIIHIFSDDLKWPLYLDVDCMVVSRNALRNLEALPEGVSVSQLVADGTNRGMVIGRLERDAASRGIAFHATGRSGAFIKKIQ